ncbi:tryptophanase [Shuttleworthella satelles]|uniref:tryptophanase n=1 Tax=Shuttleworthella satelles TaxID=177972 RepID=UPI0028D90BCB|nr:tryptophanase [Shuttleworthia satelles]
MEYPLNVEAPKSFTHVVRNLPTVTAEQRLRALKATHYNEFAFPAGMLYVDCLSDSGTTSMTDAQWGAMFLGDESYGRNKGYYVLLDAFRDVWERGDQQKRAIDLLRSGVDKDDVEKMMDELYLVDTEGGFINGGSYQLERPNTFIVPQGRCAEALLFDVIKPLLAKRYPGKVFTIPSNAHFDTTEGNIKQMGSVPRNLFHKELLFEIPEGGKYEKNPFKGDMDIDKLNQLLESVGIENVPLIYTTVTNNSVCGQPVSMANMRAVSAIAHKHGIPFVMDGARWAENCYFIKMNEEGYADKSIAEIAKEMFSYFDVVSASLKKNGHANMGGLLAFRDKGYFWKNFSEFNEDGSVKVDIGHLLKVRQISAYGNDSYGGMSGHDIMALCVGLYEEQRFEYQDERVRQCEYLAQGLHQAGVPVVLPAGGHGVYIDVDKFFGYKRDHESFAGQALSLEMIHRYGIRCSELGDFSMEYDLKTPEQKAEVCNVVRLAINRSQYSKQHMDYIIAAAAQLYKDRDTIPNLKITFGRTLPMRHFHAWLEPYEPSREELCDQ